MENQANIPPTYKAMLEEMGNQLRSRKTLLLKRTLLISWPYLLLIVAFFVLDSQDGLGFNSFITEENIFMWLLAGAGVVFLSVVYSVIVGFIFEIEKRIWVDAHFDNKHLEPKDSWRIAKKLFVPAFVMRFKIAFRYYVLPVIGFVAVVGIIVVGLAQMGLGQAAVVATVLSPFLAIIGIIIFSYYIRTKLRYVWFIFLDKYGTEYTHHQLIEEMNKLNTVSKSETFKKSLIANLGTDSVNLLANVAIGTISHGMSMFGKGGKLLGNLTQAYGQALSRQAADLGNIAGQYLIYRFALKEVYGKEQVVNEELYRL